MTTNICIIITIIIIIITATKIMFLAIILRNLHEKDKMKTLLTFASGCSKNVISEEFSYHSHHPFVQLCLFFSLQNNQSLNSNHTHITLSETAEDERDKQNQSETGHHRRLIILWDKANSMWSAVPR